MDVKKVLEEKNVDVLRFTYVGLDGIIRSKGAHVSVVNDMIRTGIGLSKAMLSYTPMDRYLLTVPSGLGMRTSSLFRTWEPSQSSLRRRWCSAISTTETALGR